nr:Fic family protein [uncultured Holophaga sp.]
MSLEGDACRALLAQPLSLRDPVSYRREFLDRYVPNETFYLPAETRQRLAVAGGPKEPDHPAGTYARQILQRLLIDLSWNSSRLEGNTYSLLDTEKLIEWGETAEGKNLQETQMILNHKAAIEYMVDSASALYPNATTVQNLHALLMENLLANPMDEGCLRVAPVGIRGTSYIPTAVPQVIDECFRQILRTADDIEDPFEQSFFLLVHIPYLQPFLDGNKRTGRLAANIPFIRKNCIPITFMDVPPEDFTDGVLAVYEMNRVELLRDVYVFAYERSCARYGAVKSSLGEPDPFRLRYRTDIKTIVREVVLAGKTIQEADAQIRAYADAKLPKEARNRFLVVVETELASIHDGNFARYQLRPSEFAEWKHRTQA